MKICLVGFSRSGKDESGACLGKITGLKYAGSLSWFAKEEVARALGVSSMLAWQERHQHRDFWKSYLDGMRDADQTFLARKALAEGDIVTGLRDRVELEACRREKLFDCVLWIERTGVHEDNTVTFTAGDADDVILNDGSLGELYSKLFVWAEGRGLLKNLLRV